MHRPLMCHRLAHASILLAIGACAQQPSPGSAFETEKKALGAAGVVVYGSEGPLLRTYALDLASGQLTAGSSVGFAVNVQYAAADRKSGQLYVSSSNGSTSHLLSAFDIDPVSGGLTAKGTLVPSGGRIISLSVNHQASHLALAHNQTAKAGIVALAGDGSLAGEVPQTDPSTGPFPHQAKFDPSGVSVVVPGLALNGGDGTLTVFDFEAGQLTKTQTLVFGAGLGARHLDYGHNRFVYVAMERGNRLYTYRFADRRLSDSPIFDQSTLANPVHNAIARQRAGAIHVHPNGRFLYLSNRQDALAADGTLPGENNIAVFALNHTTGEPSLIEHVETQGVEARTFTIDPTGQYLVVGNQVTRTVGGVVVPRSLVVFRIGLDGKLTFKQKYDISGGDVFWVGSVAL